MLIFAIANNPKYILVELNKKGWRKIKISESGRLVNWDLNLFESFH